MLRWLPCSTMEPWRQPSIVISSQSLNRLGRVVALVVTTAGVLACGGSSSEPARGAQVLDAKGLWQVEPLRLLVVTPSDMRVSSRNRVWLADTTHNVVFRINPPADEFLRFGFKEEAPVELVRPQRLAVHPTLGIFVYDAGTEQVDLYSQDGAVHLRGFPLEFEPELMSVADQPFGLVFGIVDRLEDDNYGLRIVRTGINGEGRDTLLGPNHGPPALRGLATPIGDVFVAPSRAGFWVWARSVPDTVFEIAPFERGRRVILEPEHREITGLMNDRQKGILWAMVSDTAGIAFQAYDHAQPGPDGRAPFVATRRVPATVLPFDANDGILVAWAKTMGGEYLTRAYDMKVDSIPVRGAPEAAGADGQPTGDWSRPGGG